MNIRLMTPDELGIAVEIYKDVVKDMNERGLYNWNKDYPSVEIIKNDLENNSVYCIEEDGKVVGTVTIDDIVTPEYHDLKWNIEGPFLSFHRIAIHPSALGRGYGKKFIAFAEDLAKKNNYKSIRIDSYHRNERAVTLYKNLGYKHVGDISVKKLAEPFHCFEKEII